METRQTALSFRNVDGPIVLVSLGDRSIEDWSPLAAIEDRNLGVDMVE